MALEKQNFAISLGTGMDTKTDPKQVVPGKLLYLKNATLGKLMKLLKRPGYGLLHSGSAGNALATYRDELLVFDGTNLKSRSAFDSTLYTKGQKIACSVEAKSIVSNSYEQTNADSAIHSSGFRIFAWDDSSGGVRYSVFDDTTGQAIVPSTLLATTASRAKVIAIGSYVLIFYCDSTTPSLKYIAFNSASPTSPAAAVTVATITQNAYDVALINGALKIVYSDSGAQTSIKSLSSSLVLGSAYQVNKNVSRLGIFADASNQPWIIYNDSAGTTVGYFIVNAALSATVLAATTIQTGLTFSNVTGYISGSNGVAIYEVVASSSSDNYVRKSTLTAGGVVSGQADLLRSVGIFTKPFTYGSKKYFGVAHESDLQSTYFIIDDSAKVVAKVAPSSGGGLRTDNILAEVNTDGSTGRQFAYLFKDFVTSVNGDVTTQTGINSGKITFDTAIVSGGIGESLIASGGVITQYDGISAVEHGFHLYPEGVTAETVVGSGGIGAGSYQVCSLYEWIDNQGGIHRSAPSIPETVVTDEDGVYIAGSVTNGFAGITYASVADLLKRTYGSITGPGLSGTVYVYNYLNQLSTTTLSANATATTSGTYVVQPNLSIAGTTTIGSKVITLYDQYGYLKKVDCTSGSNQVYFYNTYGLRVGMKFEIYPLSGTIATITAINGNWITTDINAPNTFTNGSIDILFYIVGTTTNGSNQITNVVNPTLYSVGDRLNINGFGVTSVTITNISGTTFTVNATASASFVATTGNIFVLNEVPGVGQTITQIVGTSAFGAPVEVTAVDAANRSVTVSEQASVTASTLAFHSSDVYAINVNVPTLRITEKVGSVGPVSIVVYRTEENGTTFYRSTSITDPTYNDTTVDSVDIVDTISDAELVGNELLYTTGNVVPNIAPPAADSIFTFKNRVCLIPSESKSQMWYSKPVVPGTPIEFSDEFIVNIPEKDGNVVTGKQLDDKLILFKENVPFILFGDGPNNTGANNDFGDPQELPADCGCVDKKSVVSMPMGLMFKSSKGIYLLDRSLQAKYIGADVEDYNSYDVTSVQKIEDSNQIRFSLSGVSTVLVYDYFTNLWSVFENMAAVDAVIYNGNYTYLKSNGSVLTETPSLFLDDTAHIPLGLKTSWLSLAGIQGFQRVWNMLILGDYVSPHTIQIDVAYDFESSYNQTTVIPVLSAPSGKYQYEVKFNKQKCEAIQITLSETQAGPYGEGLSLSSFTLEVGQKKGHEKKGSARTYG
jgi:hypothetical protein